MGVLFLSRAFNPILLPLAFVTLGGFATSTSAQEASVSDADAAAQANNPLADIRAFNIQNYYIGEFTGLPDVSGNQFVLRYAQPVSLGNTDWLIRASRREALPVKKLTRKQFFYFKSAISSVTRAN